MSDSGRRRISPRHIATALFLWLGIGFAAGTGTLLGPVRWVTGAMRAADWSDGAEKIAVLAIIALYVALSCLLSFKLAGWMARSRSKLRYAVPVVVWTAAGACLWLWMTPQVVNGIQPVEITSVARFTFGPYPDNERFEQLRGEGYTAVVTLLHPAVVPFESNLLARERELASEFGIELIEAPMLPWVSDNRESIATLRDLARTDHGRYYVHCYLGRDRVGAVRRLVEKIVGAGTVADARGEALERRDLADKPFERGRVFRIDDGVWLTPFPTDEEMLARVLGGDYHVVSLLDPANPEDRSWIDKEREVLRQFDVPFSLRPVSWQRFEPMAALAAAEFVRALPRPVIVHAFRSEGVAGDAFRAAYATRSAPVAMSAFGEPMVGGNARVVGAGVVIGPRPAGPEFGTYLAARGIRGIVYLGDPSQVSAANDRIVATREAGLQWQSLAPGSTRLFEILGSDGPWYVYGPALGEAQGRIAAHFKPQLVAVDGAPVERAGGM